MVNYTAQQSLEIYHSTEVNFFTQFIIFFIVLDTHEMERKHYYLDSQSSVDKVNICGVKNDKQAKIIKLCALCSRPKL